MAKYSTMAKYIAGMRGSQLTATLAGRDEPIPLSELTADQSREYIAQMYQRLADNGVDLGDGKAFYDSVYGNSYGSSDGMSDDSINAMAFMCAQLDNMQSTGQIDMDTYKDMMLGIISPENVESMKAYNYDNFMSMTDQVDDLRSADINSDLRAENQKANKDALQVGQRTVINSRADYLESARAADPSRANGIPEGTDMYTDMVGMINDAYDQGYFGEGKDGEDAKQAALDALKSYDNAWGINVSPTDREIMYYAMQDSLATGDEELIREIFSKDGFNVVGGQSFLFGNKDAESVNVLRRLEDARNNPGVEVNAGEMQIEVQDSVKPIDTLIPPKWSDFRDLHAYEQDVIDRPKVVVDEETMDTIIDQMATNYFENQGEDGITMDEYADLSQRYAALEAGTPKELAEKQAMFRETFPEFAAADRYMQQLETLKENVNNGRVEICVAQDEAGNDIYDIRYNRQSDRDFDRRITALDGMLENGEGITVGGINPNTLPLIKFDGKDQTFNPEFILYDNTAQDPNIMIWREKLEINPESLPIHFDDSLIVDMNVAIGQVGLEDDLTKTDEKDKGADEKMPGIDYDAPIDANDLAIVTQKSPMEQFEDMRSAAEAIWNGELGNGQERRDMLEQMGFSSEDMTRIQDMVNQGQEWCKSATAADYDAAFPSSDGTTLAERDAAFRVEQASAASRLMTYEGAADLMASYNEIAGEGEAITEDVAAGIYNSAAHVLDQAEQDMIMPADRSEDEVEEAGANLADYISTHSDAEFNGSVDQNTGEVMWLHDMTIPGVEGEGHDEASAGDEEYIPG